MKYKIEVEVDESKLIELADSEGIEYENVEELIQNEMGCVNSSGITCVDIVKSEIETPCGDISGYIDTDPACPNITVSVDDTAFVRVEYTDDQGIRAICYDKENDNPLLVQPWSNKYHNL